MTVIAFLAAGFTLDRFLGTIIDVTAMIGAKYDSSTFNGEGVNIFRVMVCFVPTILSFVYQEKICFGIERKNCLFLNLAMLNGLIMFVGLFGTANYFARLANYFLIMQAIALPWIFKKIGGKEGNLLAFICVLGYCGYFYYESAILRPFDILYSQTSLWNYLKGILS